MTGVYIITNTTNNKHYIGESLNVYKRLTQHKSNLKAGRHNNQFLQRAVNHSGIENFTFELLEEYPLDYIKAFESYWCNLLNTHNSDYGYNLDSCDPSGIKRKKSTYTKKLISEKAKGRYDGEKNPFYGKTHSNSTKELLSKLHKGKKLSPSHVEVVRKNGQNRTGINHPGSRSVTNTETRKIYISAKEAAEQESVNYRTMTWYLKHNKTKYKWTDLI